MHQQRNARARGIGCAVVSLFLLGAMPVISTSRPVGYGALVFAFWMSFWQLLLALPLFIRESNKKQLSCLMTLRQLCSGSMLFTGILFALATWFYILAFDKVGAVNAAIALQAYPLCAAMTEVIICRKRKTRREIFWMCVIVFSLYHLSTQGTWRLSGGSAWFLIALAVPVLWSIAHVILREALINTPVTPGQITVSRLAITCVFLFPLAFISGSQSFFSTVSFTEFQIFALIMGGCYYLELMFWFNAVKYIEVSLASSITSPSPLVTLFLSALFLSETVTAMQIYIMLIILCALFMLLKESKRIAYPEIRANT